MKLVVGIDQAATSGYAVVQRFRPVFWGLVRTEEERRRVIASVVDLALGDLSEVLWVLEDHGKIPLWYKAAPNAETGEDPERNTDTVLGLGEARGRWLGQLELCGVTDSRILKVPPTTWRHAVLKRRKPGQDWKQTAVEHASALALGVGSTALDHNVAEALCIAMWGAFAGLARREQKRVADNYHARERRRRKGAKGSAGRQLELDGGKESA